MIFPLLFLSGGFLGLRWYKKRHALTPERKAAFDRAMNDVMATPDSLRALAASFKKVGLSDQATTLMKRAALKEAPPEVKAARREVFTKALNSTDPEFIAKVAEAHEQIGATGAAEVLRQQVESVKAVKDA